MKHPYITDKRYWKGAVFLLIFTALAYWTGYEYNDYRLAIVCSVGFPLAAIIGYFKMKR